METSKPNPFFITLAGRLDYAGPPRWWAGDEVENHPLPHGHYFWDEAWSQCCGPFPDGEAARQALEKYALSLEDPGVAAAKMQSEQIADLRRQLKSMEAALDEQFAKVPESERIVALAGPLKWTSLGQWIDKLMRLQSSKKLEQVRDELNAAWLKLGRGWVLHSPPGEVTYAMARIEDALKLLQEMDTGEKPDELDYEKVESAVAGPEKPVSFAQAYEHREPPKPALEVVLAALMNRTAYVQAFTVSAKSNEPRRLDNFTVQIREPILNVMTGKQHYASRTYVYSRDQDPEMLTEDFIEKIKKACKDISRTMGE